MSERPLNSPTEVWEVPPQAPFMLVIQMIDATGRPIGSRETLFGQKDFEGFIAHNGQKLGMNPTLEETEALKKVLASMELMAAAGSRGALHCLNELRKATKP